MSSSCAKERLWSLKEISKNRVNTLIGNQPLRPVLKRARSQRRPSHYNSGMNV